MTIGYLSLVLHAHLPFVRHAEHEHFLEEDWLYEAITETYLPLVQALDNLARDNISPRLTITISPPLAAMLRDDLLRRRYQRFLGHLIGLAEKEVVRTRGDERFEPLARMYLDRFQGVRACLMDRCKGDLLEAFREHEEHGRIEIGTCAATHGFLPYMQAHPEAVNAQIRIAVESHRRHFGRDPRVIWLPECGYYPGLDTFLRDAGLRAFFMDTHGVRHAIPRPQLDVFAPLYTPAGVAVFARDPESSAQVWSSQAGYPGDPVYREFYRDIGWDLPLDYIGPWVQPGGARKNTGVKYFRITGRGQHKEPYHPGWARDRIWDHARHFIRGRVEQSSRLQQEYGRAPVIVAPYDAELFGHWWFEGVDFIEAVFRVLKTEAPGLKATTPSLYLHRHAAHQTALPAMSSWGHKGYGEVWLGRPNDWIYRHLMACETRMIELANRHPAADGLLRRALNQSARELLLAQSSDWAFIMTMDTAVQYAEKRFRAHVSRFNKLYGQIVSGQVDAAYLSALEGYDNIFPFVDYGVYNSRALAAASWRAAA
ncbi:MAG: 1,4-alpha-glucan branching enzyme [Myxococcota bacterium]|nr:1,4-alpha-glucan branching enzyme [Myxococcota bacterium]